MAIFRVITLRFGGLTSPLPYGFCFFSGVGQKLGAPQNVQGAPQITEHWMMEVPKYNGMFMEGTLLESNSELTNRKLVFGRQSFPFWAPPMIKGELIVFGRVVSMVLGFLGWFLQEIIPSTFHYPRVVSHDVCMSR